MSLWLFFWMTEVLWVVLLQSCVVAASLCLGGLVLLIIVSALAW